MSSIGPLKVSAADAGPIDVTTSVSEFVTVFGIADQADDRDQRDQRREDRQHRVVGQRRRPVGEVVLLELRDRALDRLHDAALARVRRALRPAAGALLLGPVSPAQPSDLSRADMSGGPGLLGLLLRAVLQLARPARGRLPSPSPAACSATCLPRSSASWPVSLAFSLTWSAIGPIFSSSTLVDGTAGRRGTRPPRRRSPRPSGFSWATPPRGWAPCLTSSAVGSRARDLRAQRVDLVGDRFLGAPGDVGLVAERLHRVAHLLASLLYVLPDLAWVLAHSMSSFTLSWPARAPAAPPA